MSIFVIIKVYINTVSFNCSTTILRLLCLSVCYLHTVHNKPNTSNTPLPSVLPCVAFSGSLLIFIFINIVCAVGVPFCSINDTFILSGVIATTFDGKNYNKCNCRHSEISPSQFPPLSLILFVNLLSFIYLYLCDFLMTP
mgnify:CR=1 FL=1